MPTVAEADALDDPALLEAGGGCSPRDAPSPGRRSCPAAAGAAARVAFAGRSNVGKSSLINALTGRNQSRARIAHAGADAEINLFDLAGG